MRLRTAPAKRSPDPRSASASKSTPRRRSSARCKAEQALAKCAQAPCPAPVHATFDAEDAASPIAHAEYSLDAGSWQYIDPVGKLSDSKREHYDFEIPASALEGKTGEHLITVRVYDRHDNIGVAKTVFNIPAAK